MGHAGHAAGPMVSLCRDLRRGPRARLSRQGYEETSYSPCFQGMGGIKFFVIKYLAFFGEAKWTQGWHTFKYETDWYWERYSLSTIQVVGGVALHF